MTVIGSALVVGSGALWVAGLRLFIRSELSRHRKLTWSAFLLLVGVGAGVVLPLSELRSKFLLVLAMLPLLAVVDAWLVRSGHGLSFWIRACGFEVCSVFGAAAVARYVFDIAGIPPFLARGG